MKRGLIILFFFIVTAALLSVATVYVPAIVDSALIRQSEKGGMLVSAEELFEKPQTYFSLDNPDSYVLQAISNPGKFVFIGPHTNDTQIDEIIHDYGSATTINVEFNNHYYNIAKGSVTVGPPEEMVLIPILILGWILWGTSIIATVIIRFSRKRSNKTTKVP